MSANIQTLLAVASLLFLNTSAYKGEVALANARAISVSARQENRSFADLTKRKCGGVVCGNDRCALGAGPCTYR
jgi:uncharacterized membrane protein